MTRPDLRPMKALPMLEARRDELEKCVFCPKLSRSACPVSNAEPRETLTPWGKMSMTYFLANGDVALEPSFAAPTYGCTGCMKCREHCDHKNDVAGTLYDARAEIVAKGIAPTAATRSIAGFADHDARTRDKTRALAAECGARADSRQAVLVGCSYVHHAQAEAKDAVLAAKALVGAVSLAPGCCGLPLKLAGDGPGFVRHAQRFAEENATAERMLVVDAGCAMTLRTHYRAAGVTLRPEVELLVERAARDLGSLREIGQRGGAPDENVRWHDPCQLGRGLGVYEAPRAVLTRIFGRAPDEFDTRREQSTCSGAGGLLPQTMPGVAREIAKTRLDEHERNGGGRVITACASSLRSFRKQHARVDDIVTWIARATQR